MLVAQKAKFNREVEQIEQELAECREENQEAIDAHGDLGKAGAKLPPRLPRLRLLPTRSQPRSQPPKKKKKLGNAKLTKMAAAAAARRRRGRPAKDAERQKDAEKMFDGENHGQVPDAKARISMLKQSSWTSKANPSSLRLRYPTSTRR